MFYFQDPPTTLWPIPFPSPPFVDSDSTSLYSINKSPICCGGGSAPLASSSSSTYLSFISCHPYNRRKLVRIAHSIAIDSDQAANKREKGEAYSSSVGNEEGPGVVDECGEKFLDCSVCKGLRGERYRWSRQSYWQGVRKRLGLRVFKNLERERTKRESFLLTHLDSHNAS